MVGTLASRGLTVVSSIVVARLLGHIKFGEFGIVQSTIVMFTTVAAFGMGVSNTKFIAELHSRDPARAGEIIAISKRISFTTSFAAAAALFFGSHLIASIVFHAPELASAIKISSIAVLFGGLSTEQTGILSGFEAFSWIAFSNAVVGISSVLALVIGAYVAGLNGVIVGIAIAAIVNFAITSIGVSREAKLKGIPPSKTYSSRCLREVMSFSVPALFSALMGGPVLWLCNTIIISQPDGYAQLGLYNAASQWSQLMLIIPVLLSSVSLPVLASLRSAGKINEYREVLTTNVKINVVIASIVALTVAAASGVILSLYGAAFRPAAAILRVLCGVSVVAAACQVVGQILISEGRMWLSLALNAGWATVLIASTWTLRRYGGAGLSIAFGIAYSFHLIAIALFVRSWIAKNSAEVPPVSEAATP